VTILAGNDFGLVAFAGPADARLRSGSGFSSKYTTHRRSAWIEEVPAIEVG
jgi:hypothetical protein